MSGAISRDQVEHEARRRLGYRLLLAGPLTARGLASDTGRPPAEVGHHLKVLYRGGAVASGEDRFKGDEIAYSLRLDGMPRWAYEGLLGRFRASTMMEVMAAIPEADRAGVAAVVERVGLSEEETTRYLLFLDALGVVVFASLTRDERGRVRRALRRHRDFIRWKRYLGLLRNGDFGSGGS